MTAPAAEDLVRTAREWDLAMVGNDPAAIGRFMAEDWRIIGSDGSMGDKPGFLALVAAGDLTHDVMESREVEVRVYGETAVMTARGVSGGQYRGRRFLEHERVSCVFVRQHGAWRCVLTHLSRLGSSAS